MRKTKDEQLIAQLELLFYEVRNDPNMDWPTHEINRLKCHYGYTIKDMNASQDPQEQQKLSYEAAMMEDIIRAFVLHRDYKRAFADHKPSQYRQNNWYLGYRD